MKQDVAVGELQSLNLDLKVSRKHIIELSDENIVEGNDEAKILHIVNCENLAEAQEKIFNLNFHKFPKAFVVLIELLNGNEDDTDELLEIILHKFADNSRPLLVELSSTSFTEFYYKQRNVDFFSSVSLDVPKTMLKDKIDKGGLTCDAFLLIMENSLLDADLSKVFEYLKDTEIHPLMHVVNKCDELCFRLFDLFDLNLPEEFKDEILLHAVEFKKFDLLLAFFNAFNESQVTQVHISKILSLKYGAKSQNAFMMAIETKNMQLTKLLLGFSADFADFFNFKLLDEALIAIKKREFFEVLDDLKNCKFNLTSEEVKKKKTLVLECEKLLSEISQLKSSIKGRKIDEIKDFAKKYPDLRLCYGKSEVCVLELSIDSKSFNIYALLRSLGFYTDKAAEFYRKVQKLTVEEREKIRDENMKHFVSNSEAFIGIIQSKCTFEPQSPIASSELREMLLDLNRFDEIRSTYPTVAHSNVQINFDFKTKTIHVMDPLQSDLALGVAYHETGVLYLALNDSKNQRYGTFAHELMHLVLHLVFENDCLPYCKDDIEREAEWTKIVEDLSEYCEKNPKTEEIIELVFGYKASKWLIEMAVRVNDMLGFYHDNEEKIGELEGLHPELFSFIREKVLADLKIPNVYRMIKLNNDFGLLKSIEKSPLQVKPTNNQLLSQINDKKLILCSNVPQLLLSKVLNEIKGLPGNKLNLKAQNFFVNFEKLDHFKSEFEDLIEKMRTEVESDSNLICRVVIDLHKILLKPGLKDLHKEVEKTFKNLQMQQNENFEFLCGLKFQLIFVVSSLSDLPTDFIPQDHNFEQQPTHNINWQHLTKETQHFLLNKSITFQEENYLKLEEILSDGETSITPEILTILCSDSEIQVNCESKVEEVQKFIERTVQVKKDAQREGEFEELLLKDFATQSDPILVISDVAGSGKTTLLSKIHEIIMQSFPQYFIIFISLLKYVEKLKEGVGDSFAEFIAKILNFDPLERQIFMQKYSKGEVKILFDAFDEISPNCKENTTKLFQLFDKNNKNQVFITTRTHLEHDLEKDLKILAHKIKILTEEEQVKFLEESWGNSNRELVKKCAEMLVRKISDIILSKPSLIGVPLIVRGLAEAFKDKINENFQREIQNLDILKIYEKIIDNSFDILSSRFPKKPVKNQKKSMNPLQLHQFLAICLFFSEEFANLLGLNHDEDEWSFEEIARFGLIKYDKDEKFHFNHQTYAEFLVAVFIFHLLKIVKKLSPVQLDFIFQVLTSEKFQVTRMFLDSMLNKVEDVQSLKSFNSSHKICERVQNQKNFLNFCMHEKLFNVFEFFTLAVKKSDVELFKEVIERREAKNSEPNLMRILPRATSLTKFEKFLGEILSFYSENVLDDFLLKTNEYGDKILHYFASNCKSRAIFECFWHKIEVLIVEEAKMRDFLLLKGGYFGGSVLLMSIAHQNENSFYFLFEEVFCKYFSIREFAYETDKYGEIILHRLATFGSVSMLKFALEKLKNAFSSEEFKNFVKLRTQSGENILHSAAFSYGNGNSVEFFVNFIENEVGNEEIKKMLSELDNYKQLPLHYAIQVNDSTVFDFFFALYDQYFNFDELKTLFTASGSYNENFLTSMCEKNKKYVNHEHTKLQKMLDEAHRH